MTTNFDEWVIELTDAVERFFADNDFHNCAIWGHKRYGTWIVIETHSVYSEMENGEQIVLCPRCDRALLQEYLRRVFGREPMHALYGATLPVIRETVYSV